MTPASSRRRILIVNTGGTFGMLPDRHGFARDLEARVPEIAEIADVGFDSPFLLDSSSIGPEHWRVLASLIAREMESYDGFVVTHGTDTMAYTAAALSFFLENLAKPVVLTGAQRPLSSIRNDARNNLIDAVEVATRAIPEVVICFGGLVLRGNRSRKRSLSDYRAFESPNYPPLGTIGTALRIRERRLRQPRGSFRLRDELDSRVVHVRLAPGITGSTLRGLDSPDVRGIVLEAFGAGNMPLDEETLVPRLARFVERGVPVVVVSGCEHGTVDLGLYPPAQAAAAAGAISGVDLTGEAAVVKLMVALGRDATMDAVRGLMGRDLAGEITT